MKLLQFFIVVILSYLFMKFGVLLFWAPIPSSVIRMYMAVIVVVTLLYMTFSADGVEGIFGPIKTMLTSDKGMAKICRYVVFAAFPIIVALLTFSIAGGDLSALPKISQTFDEPAALRVQHPAPPGSVKIFKKTRNMQTLSNPYRVEDPEELKKNIHEGGIVYYKNCFFCHGDKLAGAGHFAAGFNPTPINFTDVGTIAQLQEGFVFWRIATGGPGLPKESTPWLSSMPIWQDILTEEEIWKSILYIYDYTGYVPRSWD